jgi:hypothetical protein
MDHIEIDLGEGMHARYDGVEIVILAGKHEIHLDTAMLQRLTDAVAKFRSNKSGDHQS